MHYYENKHNINNNNSQNFVVYRYIDDVIFFGIDSNCVDFLNCYPSYLNLHLQNNYSNSAHFLDLKLEIVENRLNFDVYDKRSDYNFKINRYPHWDSNLHKSVFKGVILTQIYRINRIINNSWDRLIILDQFISNLKENDYPFDFIFKYINRNAFIYNCKKIL